MINIKTNSIDLILINNKENNNVNEELLRVLKPGGYLFGIDKPNKSHNSVCDIEDIGFEIKDSISYFFAENEDIKQDTICLAMKPLSEKNFAENVMKWGTGGLNIGKTRIKIRDDVNLDSLQKNFNSMGYDGSYTCIENINKYNSEGRYPANFIISEDVAPILDEQSKEASRFFYNAKSYKDLLRYITVLGLPPKNSKTLFVGFDNVDEIIEEINKESNVKYEAITIGGVE